VTYSLKIDADVDADIVAWLDRQTNKSEAIRDALRNHIRGGKTVSLVDVYQTLIRIERKVQNGITPTGERAMNDTVNEPPEAAAALDALAAL
jgi:hypothetical protein